MGEYFSRADASVIECTLEHRHEFNVMRGDLLFNLEIRTAFNPHHFYERGDRIHCPVEDVRNDLGG